MFLSTHGIIRSINGAVAPFSDDYSFEYDGVSDYIDYSSTSGSISSDTQGTISIWVKPNDVTSNQTMVCFSASAHTRRYISLSLNSTYGLYVDMRTITSSSSGFFVHADTNPFSVGVWTHIALVQNGVSPQLYVDGVAVAQTFLGSTNDQKWINDMIGFNTINTGRLLTSNLNQNYFDGKTNELCYFNTALTSTQIATIYGSGVPTDISSLSPVGWWREENSTFANGDWTIEDSGSGGNDATSVSMSSSSRTSDVPT